MPSIYNDPAYMASRNWLSVEEWIAPAERVALCAELGVSEDEARTDRKKSYRLIELWRRRFATGVRDSLPNGRPESRCELIARTIELALALNLGPRRGGPVLWVRLRFGFPRRGHWRCEIHADGNTDPDRPWRTAWRSPHEQCFVHVDDEGCHLSWADGFTESAQADALLFMQRVDSIQQYFAPPQVRYCKWLLGLLGHVRNGAEPAFYWPGYDGANLTATRLFNGAVDSFELPRSPWK